MAEFDVVTPTRCERPVLDELGMRYRQVCESPSDINNNGLTILERNEARHGTGFSHPDDAG